MNAKRNRQMLITTFVFKTYFSSAQMFFYSSVVVTSILVGLHLNASTFTVVGESIKESIGVVCAMNKIQMWF